MKHKIGKILLYIAAAISTFTALAHLSCIILGESCYRTQLAPDIIIQSSIDGSLLAPLGTIIVSLIFLLCAAYALSAIYQSIKLPFTTLAIYTISLICLLRGIATIPLSYMAPDLVTTFTMASGALWFLTGAFFLSGFHLTHRHS